MTEAEWLTETSPTRMINLLKRNVSKRKLRLVLVSTARLIWKQIPEVWMRDAVEYSEYYADNSRGAGLLEASRKRFQSYYRKDSYRAENERQLFGHPEKEAILTMVRMTALSDNHLADAYNSERDNQRISKYHCYIIPIIHEIFGNPFRPVAFNPSWGTSTVHSLSAAIYDEKAFDRLPILADALQDAGCDSEDILNHLRQPGEHCRGCWALDLVLDKE